MGQDRHDEPGWNPYRWVEVSDQPITHQPPSYRHRFSGLSGRFDCTLEVLTPLFVGDGRGNFVGLSSPRKQPFIPGTSLKGAIRSLAELVGNAAVPFPKSTVDVGHRLEAACIETGSDFSLDCVARTFGYLKGGRVFAGLVQFGDATWVQSPDPPDRWRPVEVVAGQPKPDHHWFYPTTAARKFYHHKTQATQLTGPQANIRQTRPVKPAPPTTTFRFSVQFENLRNEELTLLAYCLVLEEDVRVELSTEALGPDFHEPVTLRGPMRHKLGGCKPQGGGSVHIRVDRLTLRGDPLTRYRTGQSTPEVFEAETLAQRLTALTRPIASRDDPTMRQLRAMLVYDANDPRARDLDYPSYAWFQEDKQRPPDQRGRLKPTH